jgi:NAD(P)-dependent dehydrogenase (short-subunit alcohol dehydrogenase family)
MARVAVVTGGTRGIGGAISKALKAAGCKVAAITKSPLSRAFSLSICAVDASAASEYWIGWDGLLSLPPAG